MFAALAITHSQAKPTIRWIRWSEAKRWRGSLPARGDTVTIPRGIGVLLDVSPPPLSFLHIQGTLRFQEQDLTLSASSIDVEGAFEIGSARQPFRHQARVVLGNAFGPATDRMLAVEAGGTLELHGQSLAPVWLHLVSSAARGADHLIVERSVPWQGGDELFIASSEFDAHQAERSRIRAVRGDTLELETPLRFAHRGVVANGIDERAEVGLLSRNVIIEGPEDAARDGRGGCVMMMAGSQAQIADTEFRRMGQKGRLGRYPIHFHRVGDGRGSSVRGCSIHDCYNRFLTLHGTNGVLVSDNVGFDTIGHGFFLEDGIETGNVLERNLGALTRRASPGAALLPSDYQPSVFWITHPANILRDNVAAGSDYHGFWFALPPHPTGPSRTTETDRSCWPRRTLLGVFTGNVAHSNEHDGLFVDNLPNPPGVSEAPSYTPSGTAHFTAFTSYRNRRHGAWLRGTNLCLQNARIADCAIGVTFAGSECALSDSLIVGETDGSDLTPHSDSPPKGDDPHFPLRGFEFYDGRVSVARTTFVNFQPDAQRPASALSCLRFSPFFVDPRNSAEGLRFVNALPVYYERRHAPRNPDLSGDGYRSTVFQDRDGSIAGVANRAIVIDNPLLVNDRCVAHPQWNASVCDNAYGRLFLDNQDKTPREIGPVTLRRDSDPDAIPYRLWGNPRPGPNTSFQTILISGEAYSVDFDGGSLPAPLRITLRHRLPGDWVTLSLPASLGAFVYAGIHHETRLPLGESRDELEKATASAACQIKDRLVVKLVVPPGAKQGEAVVTVCSQEGCR